MSTFIKEDTHGIPFIEYTISINDNEKTNKLLHKRLQDVTSLYRNLGAEHAALEQLMGKPLEMD